MRYFTFPGLLILMLSTSAFGDVIDPNVGFCEAPASAATCDGKTQPNLIVSQTTFGMWSFGAKNANDPPWYLLVAVPQNAEAAIIPAPSITSTSFPSIAFTTNAYFLPTSTGDIYGLFSQTSNLGGSSSMNATNLFGSLEQKYFPGKPADFNVLLYTVSSGFDGNTAYSFEINSVLLPEGTFLAAIGEGTEHKNTIQFSTPFTTTGLIDSRVPDGGATLILLGGALVGLETLRRRLSI